MRRLALVVCVLALTAGCLGTVEDVLGGEPADVDGDRAVRVSPAVTGATGGVPP